MIELSFRDLDWLEVVTRVNPEQPRTDDEHNAELNTQEKVDARMRHLADLNARLRPVIASAARIPVALLGSPEPAAQPPPLTSVSMTLTFGDLSVLADELHRHLPQGARRRRKDDWVTRLLEDIEKHKAEVYRKFYDALRITERKTAARVAITEE